MRQLITTLALSVALMAPAFAVTPNRTTMSFAEFVEASGCAIVDQGGYSTLEAAGGGYCPGKVVAAFTSTGPRNTDPDGIPGNGDEN